ncbi:MAG: CAP domain-containing protein, partial [Propionibacteriaceae bacterium]
FLRLTLPTRHSVHMHRKTLISGLLGGLVMIGGSLLPASSATATTAPEQPPASSARAAATLTPAQFETRVISLVNARRTNIGCAALRTNSSLVSAARVHTRRMVRAGSMSHQLPGEPGLGRRIVNAGYLNWSAAAENIAWGASTPQRIFNLWMGSSGHRTNIQNCRYRDGGVGVVIVNGTPWVTLDFGRKR